MNSSELNDKLTDKKNELIGIIESSSAENREKELLKKLFSRLCDYNQQHISLIQNNLRNELRSIFGSNDDNFNVRTALMTIKQAESADNYFCSVCDEKQLGFGIFFDCPYGEFLRICDKREYKAVIYAGSIKTECVCVLRVDSSLADAENILFRLASQYHIKKPVIFSPYARKFASVKFDCGIPADTVTDIEIEGIPRDIMKLTSDYRLMWNVSYTDGGQQKTDSIKSLQEAEYPIPRNLVTPVFDRKKYKKSFMNISPNDFLVFDMSDGDRISFLRENNVLFVSSDDDFSDLTYHKIKIFPENSMFTGALENFYRPCTIPCARVKSHADIISTVRAFNDNPFGVTISEDYKIENKKDFESDMKTIKNYNSDTSYYKPFNIRRINRFQRLRTLKLYSSMSCILRFSGGYLAEDYANYVLEYLNETYPEFYWQGELI